MLKIKEIKYNSNIGQMKVLFEIDEKKDAFTLQEIFRDIVSARFGVECSFGISPKFQPELEFDYVITNEPSILEYDFHSSSVQYIAPNK